MIQSCIRSGYRIVRRWQLVGYAFLSVLVLGLAQLAVAAQALQPGVIDIAYGKETPTRTLLVKAPQAKALVILLVGGGGLLNLSERGFTPSQHTFVRALSEWSGHGIDAVLMDSPVDLGDLRRGDLRDRPDHLARLQSVIDYYRTQTNLPIWIFGHSMGSSSVVHYANQGGAALQNLSGLIIAGTVRTAQLHAQVRLPVLAIHHREDWCSGTPLAASEQLIALRPSGTVSQLIVMEGGETRGNVCHSFAHHGFYRIEPAFIAAAAQFILKNSTQRP